MIVENFVDTFALILVGISFLSSSAIYYNMKKIYVNKSSEDFSITTISFIGFNALMWLFWGLLQNDLVLIISNVFATSMYAIWIALIIKYNKKGDLNE